MDKNTLTGLFLIALLLIGFSYYTTTQTEETQVAEQTAQPAAKPATDSTKVSTTANKQQHIADSTDIFNGSREGENTPISLKNEQVVVTVSPKGGAISGVRLREFKSYADFHANKTAELSLIEEKTHKLNFRFETIEGLYSTEDYYFQPLAKTDSTLTMALGSSKGDTLYIDYKLIKGSYFVNTTIRTKGRSFAGKTLGIDWKNKIRQQEKGFYFENLYSTLTYKKENEGTDKLSEQKSDELKPEGNIDWIAFKDQYFSAVLIAGKNSFTNTFLKSDTCSEGSGYVKDYTATAEVAFDPTGKKATQVQFYFGPNKYLYLKGLEKYKLSNKDLDLQDLVYLGWPLFRWINRFFTIYVFDFLSGFGLNMGIVLLLITLLMRAIVYPATKKSFLSTAKMRVLRPKVDELAKKYPNKEDAMKRQQETMQLYSQYGVSPMGGCLPMFIQMPIWIAMFNFVPNAFELRQQAFLWADDLSTFDDLISWNTPIWGVGTHLSLFCVLFCCTNLLYSWLTMKQQQDSMSGEQAQQMKIMQWMTFLMPIFFFFMFNKYSSGLNYYYFVSLLTSALTMWYLRRSTDDKKLLEKLEANFRANKDNPNRKTSGLAARLQALQEQQEEIKKRQQNLGKGPSK
ncbi:membrane protein insertase YidC [uncultured Alloprevotella sp.]|uniref:membrane protein insertase YidC n=1 Tax=uncultured Alloprevotella sp. TaxID=1283315 RepID=UPI00260FCCB3|nr:membrane protein insertase YidC [uncultured Alloprevotella sp.]